MHPVPTSATPPTPAVATSSPPAGRRRPRRWRWFVLAPVLLATLFLGWRDAPAGIGRWWAAAAWEAHLDGHSDEAERKFLRALEWSPDDFSIIEARVRLWLETDRFDDALDAAQQAVERAPGDRQRRRLRAETLWAVGRFDDALDDWKAYFAGVGDSPAAALVHRLNGLAYARALAGVELDEALIDIDRALRHSPGNEALLDTRGFVHFRRGDWSAARRDLDAAVALMERYHAMASRALAERRLLRQTDSRQLARQQRAIEQSLAVIRYHRGLVREQQGEDPAADFRRVRELGFEPSETLH